MIRQHLRQRPFTFWGNSWLRFRNRQNVWLRSGPGVRAAITFIRSRSFALIRSSIPFRSAFLPGRGHFYFAETGHYHFAATPWGKIIDSPHPYH